MRISTSFFLLICACNGGGDTDTPAKQDVSALCAGAGDCGVVLGRGAPDGSFFAFEQGEAVQLDVAPQGGFGVSVYASTTGLAADGPVDVLLEPVVAGEVVGSFLATNKQLYCQEDGSGLLWGIVVGFDPSVFSTNSDLIALDGEQVELRVAITDALGTTCSGAVTVQLEVGR